jgi:hypothetical protein
MKPSELLTHAAEKVAHGWCQRSYQVGDLYCMMGAMQRTATAEYVTSSSEWNTAIRVLAKQIDPEGRLSPYGFAPSSICQRASIIRWNDAPGRTQEEVIHEMEIAAKTAEAMGQ